MAQDRVVVWVGLDALGEIEEDGAESMLMLMMMRMGVAGGVGWW